MTETVDRPQRRGAVMLMTAPRWLRWIVRLIARLVVGVFVLMTASFLLVQLSPGDPAVRLLGANASSEDIARMRESLGLDDPLTTRYVRYIGDALHLDFGTSFTSGRPVFSDISARAPDTLRLAGASLVVALVVAIPLGLVIAALTNHDRHRNLGSAFTAVTGLFAAIPPYVLAMMLVAVFAVTFKLLPIAGADGPSSLVLPALASGLPFAAVLSRIVRVEAIAVLSSDYVRTVRSKRLPARTLYLKHVLPNVLTGALTVGGVFFGYLLAGSVVVESVFAWPGIGTQLVSAISGRDYPTLQAVVLYLGLLVLVVNSIVDLVLVLLDPRLRVAS